MRTRPCRSFVEASYKSADSLRWGQGRRCVLSTIKVQGGRGGFRGIRNQEKRCCPQGSHQGNREALRESSERKGRKHRESSLPREVRVANAALSISRRHKVRHMPKDPRPT